MKALVIEDNDRLRKSLPDYLRDEGFAADASRGRIEDAIDKTPDV